MSIYPIHLKAEHIKALVIGAGNVGMRKIETLLKCNVQTITVLDSGMQLADFAYKDNPYVLFLSKAYEVVDLENHNLVFIATENKILNSSIVKDCKSKNILCNVITLPHEGSFTLPALIQKDDLLLTVSTNGLSPALSRALKEDIENFIDLGYSDLCTFLGALRKEVLALDLASDKNKQIFTFFVENLQRERLLYYFQQKDKNLLLELFKDFDSHFKHENIEYFDKIKTIIQLLLAE